MSTSWRKELDSVMQANLEDIKEDEPMLFIVSQELLREGPTPKKYKHGGSRLGCAPNVQRDRVKGHERIWKDYFAGSPAYDDRLFRRRYRMHHSLFLRILDRVCAVDDFFVQKRDAAKLVGLSSLQKMIAALWMLAYKVAADAIDEYCRLGENIAMDCMLWSVRVVRLCFEAQYLRQPMRTDLQKQLKINEDRGFPGMFASLDCMHYRWKNCPVAWQGQFQDKEKGRSIILEAIADQSLWIWHAFFELLGENNDINVLDQPPLIANLLSVVIAQTCSSH